MEENLVRSILREAARIEGSTQALATRLRAPESTLLLWLEGRAQVPLRALLNSIDFIVRWELETSETKCAFYAGTDANGRIMLSMRRLTASCSQCGGTDFHAVAPGVLRLTSRLSCTTCGEEVVQSILIGRLAKQVAQRSRSQSAQHYRPAKDEHQCFQNGGAVIEEAAIPSARK